LDTPGILWPKFEDPEVGLNLAFTGAISDEVYDIERAAEILLWRLKDDYAKNIKERYKIDEIPQTSEELFTLVGKKRGFLQKGEGEGYQADHRLRVLPCLKRPQG